MTGRGLPLPSLQPASAQDPIAFSRPFFGEAEAEAAAEAVRSGWVVGGPRLAEFERRFAAHCGGGEAIGVSSWTTGAFLVLHAWGIGAGDEVIVPSLTFIATVNVIRHAGATPVFADIDPATYNVDPADIERKITARTRAIMPVDQLGLPCDIDAVNQIARRHGLLVLDDAACAFASFNLGRPVGSLAGVTVFSLHARKVVTTGEGGMIVTDDREFAERLRRLRHQGMSLSDYARHAAAPTVFESYPEIGYNFRITDIQAGIGLAQLDRLEHMLESRRSLAARYGAALAQHPWLAPPSVPPNLVPNWQSYQIMVLPDAPMSRNEAMDRLHALGIPTRRGVMASHLEPPYRASAAPLPNTELVAANSLQLPMHSALGFAQQDRVLAALKSLANEGSR
jgi:perosamine synthetase